MIILRIGKAVDKLNLSHAAGGNVNWYIDISRSIFGKHTFESSSIEMFLLG